MWEKPLETSGKIWIPAAFLSFAMFVKNFNIFLK